MLAVRFYESSEIDDALLRFAVIIARHNGKWVYCRHHERDTFEVPGGHREPGETIEAAARRELYEETGANDFTLTPLCVYSVSGKGERVNNNGETYGMLFWADIRSLGPLPETEIASISFFDEPPENQTYPEIQPKLLEKAEEILSVHQI